MAAQNTALVVSDNQIPSTQSIPKKRGGKRIGAGRKPNIQRALQHPIKPVTAAVVLAEADEFRLWQQLLHHPDARIRLDAAKYLTDRRDGKAIILASIYLTNQKGEKLMLASRDRGVSLDADVYAVLHFMECNVEAGKLLRVARAVAALAPTLWSEIVPLELYPVLSLTESHHERQSTARQSGLGRQCAGGGSGEAADTLLPK